MTESRFDGADPRGHRGPGTVDRIAELGRVGIAALEASAGLTFVFELMPQREALDTLVFEERDGKTLVTTTTLHKTVEARDGHLASGMEGGMTEGYARMDELLEALQR